MQKRSLINKIYNDLYKSRITSHIYSDNDWSNLKAVGNRIVQTLEEVANKGKSNYAFSYGETHYEGVIGELGHRKVYDIVISDEDGNEIINGQMICSFCGTLSNPMGAYDVTVLIW